MTVPVPANVRFLSHFFLLFFCLLRLTCGLSSWEITLCAISFPLKATQQRQRSTDTSAAAPLPTGGPPRLPAAAGRGLLLPARGLPEHPPAPGQPPRRLLLRLHPHRQGLRDHPLRDLRQLLPLLPARTPPQPCRQGRPFGDCGKGGRGA